VVDGVLGIGGTLLGGYLLGSIPSGYLAGRLRGIDIRTRGSGNLGATNVVRVLGWGLGIAVLLLDVAKGFGAVALLPHLTPYAASDWLRVGIGLAAVLGHTFTCFLRFKGGKGVATTYGVLLALAPMSTLAVFFVFLIVVAATRYVSLGSLVSALLFPVLIWAVGEGGRTQAVLVLALVLALGVTWTHRSNLRRLLDGQEHKLGDTASAAKPEGPPR
jgi:acyl phosphate:glycerol-3-phosphate acyltransferase